MFNDCEPTNKPKKNIDGFTVFVITCSIIGIVAISVLIGYGISEGINQQKYDQWYNGLSVEEKAIEDARRQEEYNKKVIRFEVLNLSQYVHNVTNGFGGIVRTEIKYTFSYINENGQLVHMDSWDPANVKIGTKTNLIYDKNNGSTTLVIDKETLNNIPTLNAG